MKITSLIISCFFLILTLGSCKKCITCTAHDATSGDTKFEEKSCSQGPLLDDWENEIKTSYPEPQYNTVCK
jgi:hypothetical protein